MTNTGNFTVNYFQSKENALQAFCKLTHTIDLERLKPKKATKLFNALVSPILTYGSEVWGPYFKQNFETWEKSAIEKDHLRFCKYF